MNRRILAILGASCLAWSTSGCASLFNPGPDFVPVSTRPPGATVSLDGVPVGKSPIIVPVPRSSEGVFTFELEGYEIATVDRDKVLNGITCVNLAWILVWPMVPVGFGVDLIAGNAGKYSVQPIRVDLAPLPAGEGRSK
jgi:hypothetical protein